MITCTWQNTFVFLYLCCGVYLHSNNVNVNGLSDFSKMVAKIMSKDWSIFENPGNIFCQILEGKICLLTNQSSQIWWIWHKHLLIQYMQWWFITLPTLCVFPPYTEVLKTYERKFHLEYLCIHTLYEKMQIREWANK